MVINFTILIPLILDLLQIKNGINWPSSFEEVQNVKLIMHDKWRMMDDKQRPIAICHLSQSNTFFLKEKKYIIFIWISLGTQRIFHLVPKEAWSQSQFYKIYFTIFMFIILIREKIKVRP